MRTLTTARALKDAKKLAACGLKPKALELLAILERDPFRNPPPYEKLVEDLADTYSRHINILHRLSTKSTSMPARCVCYACGHTTSECAVTGGAHHETPG